MQATPPSEELTDPPLRLLLGADFECFRRYAVSSSYMSIFPGWLRLGTKSANLKAALFPMNLRFPFLSAVAAVALLTTSTPQALQAKSDAEQICVSVGRLLEEGHYTHQQLNAEMPKKFLPIYLAAPVSR